jgi:23S rRNA (uracil1939-C5)-methyltransferase
LRDWSSSAYTGKDGVGRKKQLPILRGVTITDIGSEGNAIARVDDMVLFVPGMIPGDVVDVRVTKKKKRYMEGVALAVTSPSPDRITPPCSHFGVCGGCRWQHLPYEKQLHYKEQQVRDNLTRIGHTAIPAVDAIVGSEKIYDYRNKLEFTFSEKRWLTREEVATGVELGKKPALGFHIPGVFDKVLDIDECLLMGGPTDAIRNEARRYAAERKLPFYDFREQRGFLRNLIVRRTTGGEVMVVLVTTESHSEERERMLSHLAGRFPEITSLYYIINIKKNDSISDLTPVLFAGSGFITEEMEDLRFRIGPKSFYQTNSTQAERLYSIVREMAQLTGSENVYDLYTGTGTIACYLASESGSVTGIEYIEEAVADARVNALENKIGNSHFVAGDIRNIFNDTLFSERGRPDVIITDPPRAGMHGDVTAAMLRSGAERIVYVSCNPATQARDIDTLSQGYDVKRVAPVDMFPHTFHVENVVLLEKKGA